MTRPSAPANASKEVPEEIFVDGVMKQATRSTRISRGPVAAVATIVASVVVGSILLEHSYGIKNIADAVARTDVRLFLLVIALGFVGQVIRARRVELMLSHEQPVSLQSSYDAMVVGHGISDLVPLVPG